MTKPYPQEFRDDVVRVARGRQPGVPIARIATDFGVHPMTLQKWMRRADIDEATTPGQTRADAEQVRELRKRNRLLEQEVEVLRQATAYLSQANLPKMMYPLVHDLAVTGIPVTVTCRVLHLARQGYYRWVDAPVTDAELTEAYRANALFDAHSNDPEFGYRLLADQAREVGEEMSNRTAWRIASANSWFSVFGAKRASSGKKPGPAVHDDRCRVVDEHGRTRHVFAADTANRLRLTDITEHPTGEGKIYCRAVTNVFAGRIVGYAIDSHMRDELAVRALNNAVAIRSSGLGGAGAVAGCVAHSDRGGPFRSRKFLDVLDTHRMVGSMGRVASCGDNAAMEPFFALLQKDVLDRRAWDTRESLRIAIVTWIERTCHRRRRQVRLGQLTPVEYETMMSVTAASAA
ncbi:IS3 family transposase [Corynebacterium sp. AOP12-C2-36]|uniref:IS3 family transposase n=1 Tax=Corynebacterium sp. AOP12-C2-36 TaxID=3457723 RepID=UPI0040347A4D